MLTLLAKLFHALNSDSSPRQIALAIVLGFIVGLSPLLTLHNIVILFIVLFLRVHIGSFILSWGVFSAISYVFSFLIVDVGEYLLTNEVFNSLFSMLYQYSVFQLAHLHHTYTLGAIITGLILAIPVYFLAILLIVKYRFHVKAFIDRFKIIKALKTSNFYRVYLSLSGQGA
jgi:uncharacterized protein (TIGR03546 family)